MGAAVFAVFFIPVLCVAVCIAERETKRDEKRESELKKIHFQRSRPWAKNYLDRKKSA